MKMFVALAFALVVASPMLAQDHAVKPTALPELQEWFSWPGAKSSRISYLPGFSAQGGMNAITQWRWNDPTWFNRFPFDTTNQFQWPEGGSKVVVQIDFTNDGTPEYFDTGGRIFVCPAKNMPPAAAPVARAPFGSSGATLIGDYNNDGFSDLLLIRTPRENEVSFDIVFGADSIVKLRYVTPGMERYDWGNVVSYYLTALGKARLLTYRREDDRESFTLYGIDFLPATGDSMQVALRELDKVEEFKSDKNEQVFVPQGCYLLRQTSMTGHALIALNDRDAAGFLYAIESDTFRLAHKFKSIGSDRLSPLRGSINADSIEELITPVLYNNQIYFGIYSGSLLDDTTVKAVIPLDKSRYGYMTFALIGDVNNDGINDIAGTSPEKNVFVVYLGKDWNSTSVNETPRPDFALSQSEPNPIEKGYKTILPFTLARTAIYTLSLYDTGGRKITDLFRGELAAGSQWLPLDLAPYSLGSGLYIVRLSDGKATAERAIIIQR